MIVLFAFASATDCALYADHTAEAATWLAGGPIEAVADLRAETFASCQAGWMPNDEITSCILTQTDPQEILACEEELRTDLEGLVWSARRADVAQN